MNTQPHQIPLDFASSGALTVEEIWTRADGPALQRLKEDNRIERKPAGIHPPELSTYLSMWANTIDGGLIVVGMENDGEISGCGTVPQKLAEQTQDRCPDARVECRRVAVTNRKGAPDYLLLFRVHYNPVKVVKSSNGDAYIRVGGSRRKLRPEEVRELEADKGQVQVEQELCPSYTFPDDFIAPLLDDYLTSIRERITYPAHLSAVEIMELRRLGKLQQGKFIPNAACVLLFAKDPLTLFPGCKIRFLRHEGDTEKSGSAWNAVKSVQVEGPIPILLKAITEVVTHQLRDFSQLGSDGKFYTVPEYPREAWLEALINACVHRSYGELRNMNIFVRMFDDRLEIESPGGFPPPVTEENIYEMHRPRNPHLMDAMMFMKYAQCAREGARRIKESMAALELPVPAFKQTDTAHSLVRVVLKNNIQLRAAWVDADAARVIGPERAKALSIQERRAVNFVAEHGKAYITEISKLLDINWQTASKLLARLTAKKVLLHVHRKDILRDPKAHFVIRPPEHAESGGE